MCQPSPTIAGFLQQAEDNLALLRARAQFTPRKAREKVAEESPGSASARMSQRLRATGSTRASPRPQEEPAELELHAVHARTLRDLDRKIRGFDARFKSMEKAVASAADLAAASSRCGRDGIEAATAATAAVRVEAEAKCRELAQRIESLAVPGRWCKDLEVKIDTMVQASLDHDLQVLERRLVAQFSKRHSEVLEAAEQMTSELKAEVGQQLQAFKDGRITAACAPTRTAEALALEGRLRIAEADLQRALRDVDDWERATRPTHHEQRIDKLEADLAKLFQRLGSTADMGVQDLPRRGVPEAPRSEAERHKAAGSALHVPITERTLQPSELACDRLGELATKGSGTVNVEQPAAELEVASNSGTPSAPPSPSMPSRPVVPFQPPSRRPTRLTVPGPGVRRMSGIHVVETPSSTSSPCECPASEIGAEQAAPTAEASAGASRDLWEKLLAGSGLSGPSGRGPGGPGPGNPRVETVHQPAEDQGRSTSRQLPSAAAAAFDQVSSSSPTLGSANLSDILRSTSAFADHASGSSSHGSQTPTPRVEEDAGQVARAQSSSGSSSGGERQPRLDQRQALEALAQDVAAEPVCAFSTNVSEAEEFGSGDDLDLPM